MMTISFGRAADSAIVGSSEKIKSMQKTFLNFSQRLYKKHAANTFTVRNKDIPTVPTFSISLSSVKSYIDEIGFL